MKINIDINKVLESKINPIEKMYAEVCESGSVVDNIKFVHMLMQQPKSVIIENMSYLYKIPNDNGIKYFDEIVRMSNMPESGLTKIKQDLDAFMSSKNGQESTAKAVELQRSAKLLDEKIKCVSSDDFVANDVMMKMHTNRLNQIYANESSTYLEDDLEIIAYNINTDYEAIFDYEKLIREVKMSSGSEYFSSFPKLIDNNTTMILNLTRNISGDVFNLFTSLPMVIADKLIDEHASKRTVNTIIAVYDKQIKRITKYAKNTTHYRLAMYYLGVIRDSKEKLGNYINDLNNKHTTVNESESVTAMQPDILSHEPEATDIYSGYDSEIIEDDLEDIIIEVLLGGDDITLESINELTRLGTAYDALYEGGKFSRTVTKASTKIEKGSRAIANKASDVGRGVSHLGKSAIKAVSPLTNKINQTIDTIKKLDKEERTTRIITGKTQMTLIRLLRAGVSAIVIAGASSVAPTAAISALIKVVGLLAAIAINKNIDSKERRRIAIDLENERKIVEEKIDDAKSKGDNKAKYELMRLKNKLDKDISRVKYHLDI